MSSYANDPGHADNTPPDSASTDSGFHHHQVDGNTHGDQENDGPGRKKKGPKRRKVNHACLYCRRSHMTCDEGRPCQRCIKREIGHLCHDERRSTAKEKISAGSINSISTPPVDLPRPLPASPYGTSTMQPALNPAWPGMGMSMAQGAFLYPPETMNEFSVLSDFLESLDDGTFFSQPTTVAPSMMSPPPYNNTVPLGVENSYISSPHASGSADPAPAAPEKPPEEPVPPVLPAATKTEKFFLTAADQASGSRNERLNMVIRSKYEAGLLKPYNYVKGYARLSRWMDRNVSLESKQKILQPLSVLRPKFRAIAQSESLTDIDLVFIEEAFERLLLDYDRVFSAMAIPACLWRRTGEIYKANREFAELVGVDGYMLRDGRMCIYELMAEDSAVNYWEKYGNVAFDSNQKAVLTSCVLRYKPLLPTAGSTTPSRKVKQTPPNEEGFISCCFSFTIRRDPYGIPTLIVGNFIKC
ncbi:hypothetical protein AcW1_002605 [Taiwanofungus camphoratus]|nr:hypothetical protein AcV5_009714 [Antrodia cinnamomea]KAI0942828.1 hypothetical protein AcV7_002131 [Antrodia cinnamomea]KAI0943448.1 hypothetical protein AcW1_002605 [Antrodia cinnamomea]